MNNTETKKKLLFHDEARSVLMDGVNQLADAVAVTMGPGGLNVVIERAGNVPILTKDGVTVARAVNLPDQMENLGVQLVKEAAQGAADVAGDGTTTSTVLARFLFSAGLKAIAAGHNSVKVRTGIKESANKIIQSLNDLSEDIKTSNQIVQIGTISANGEKEIGEYLSLAMEAVGRDGIIAVEEAKGFKTSLERISGARIDRGFISPYFINDKNKNICSLENCQILIANRKISSLREILSLLEDVHEKSTPLLIIADDVDGEALHGLVVNSTKGNLKCCVIRAPEFGQNRLGAMEDLAILTGTKVFLESDDLSKVTVSDLGKVKKAVIHKTETILMSPAGEKEKIDLRQEKLREAELTPGSSNSEKAALRRRLSRLAGGIAIIRVGGSTEAELRERKDRVDDALHATRAAVISGILPGGGVALFKCAQEIDVPKDEDIAAGYNILKSACKVPISQIVSNAGSIPEIVLEKISDKKAFEYGFNARELKYGNLKKMGVIDPALVIVSALRHAVSAADNLLSVACAMHDIEEEEEKN